MQQLSGLDASFLYLETPNAPMHVGGFAIYDPSTVPGGKTLRFTEILKNIERRLHLARAFRQKVVNVPMNLDHPWWVEDASFDIEYHVRHIALPKPGDWRQLCIQAARLHSRPLDLARPLWELYVIEGLDGIDGLPQGSFATLFKIHHAAIDGVTGAEIITALHDLEPEPKSVPKPEKSWKPEADPHPWELLARAGWNAAVRPFGFAELTMRTIPAMARLTTEFSARRLRPERLPGEVPRTRFNGTVSPHRVVEGRAFDLGEIRKIKNRVEDATVNDVVLAICGGALARYLRAKGELSEKPLVAMAPISVRTEEERGKGGNRVSAMAVGLGTHLDDPLERLRSVHQGAVESKALTNAIGARLMTDYSQFIPSATAGVAARLYSRLGLANRVQPFFNTVVTNVPGPQMPLYSHGARLVAQYGMGPVGDGVGLIHPVFSYCGQITIAATACREMMPDPGFYAECLQASYDELRDAALGPRVSAPVKRVNGKHRPSGAIAPVAAH